MGGEFHTTVAVKAFAALQDLYSFCTVGSSYSMPRFCGSGLRLGEQAPRFSSARGVSTMLLILSLFFQGFSRIRVVPSPSLLRTFTLSIKLFHDRKAKACSFLLRCSGEKRLHSLLYGSAIPQPLSLIFM